MNCMYVFIHSQLSFISVFIYFCIYILLSSFFSVVLFINVFLNLLPITTPLTICLCSSLIHHIIFRRTKIHDWYEQYVAYEVLYFIPQTPECDHLTHLRLLSWHCLEYTLVTSTLTDTHISRLISQTNMLLKRMCRLSYLSLYNVLNDLFIVYRPTKVISK